MQAGEKIEIEIVDIAFGGDGVGRMDGQVVFVPFTMIGERVEAEIWRKDKQFLRARPLRVLKPSPQRIQPRCVHFGVCAGCQYQHIPYAQQCEIKTKQVRDVMQRIGKFEAAPVKPILPSPIAFGYRSKITLHPRQGKLSYVGWDGRAFEVKECHIASPTIDEAIRKGGIEAAGQGDILYRANAAGKLFIHDLSNQSGDAEFVETLGDAIEFRLPINSFFQNNTAMVPVMLDEVRKRVEAMGDRFVIDGFCGAGFFAIYLAKRLPLKKCWGIEIDTKAIPWARKNAAAAGLKNTEFFVGAVEQVLPMLLAKNRNVTQELCVLLDPPRAGCEPKVMYSLILSKPKHLIYVSCDPATLARDLRKLCESAYTLEEVQPLDMFPQTAHIECIAVLKARP
jgi:tRNA/tmRNA/rRNA uracil-C5-methylase (TrmA/RlmC/RlmD family)